MTHQFISLAAEFADLGGPGAIAARLAEPSAATVIGVALTGLLVGRFLLGRNQD